MKRGSGCCAVDIYYTAALTSLSDSVSHITFLFSEWFIETIVSLSNSRNSYAPVNFDRAIWLPQISAFLKKSGRLSSAGPEIEDFASHCSANFQPIFVALYQILS